MAQETQDYTYRVNAARHVVSSIPFNKDAVMEYFSQLDDVPAQFLGPVQQYVVVLGCYAKDPEIRVQAAKIAVKLQNLNVQTYLQLCNNAGICPEQITAECANLLVLCPQISVKYRQLPVEVQRSGIQLSSMGWDIDEIVQLICADQVKWKFALLQTVAFEEPGFPKALCGLVCSDVLSATILPEIVGDLSFDDGILRNVLKSVLLLLFVKSPTDLYVRYIQNYFSHDTVVRFVGAAWHCLSMIRQGVYPREYEQILLLMLEELNKLSQIPADVSYQLQEVFEELFDLKNRQIDIKLTVHANIDWVLSNLPDIVKANYQLTEFQPILLSICADGRLQALDAFFSAFLECKQQFIYPSFENCFQELFALFTTYNCEVLFKQLIQPQVEFLKANSGTQFAAVHGLADFKANQKAPLKLELDPFSLLQRLSILAIYLQFFHSRPVNAVQWLSGGFEDLKLEIYTGFSIIYAVTKQFLSKAKLKLKNEFLAAIKQVSKLVFFSIEWFLGREFGCCMIKKERSLQVPKPFNCNVYVQMFQNLREQKHEKHSLPSFAAHSTMFSSEKRALKLLAAAGLDAGEAANRSQNKPLTQQQVESGAACKLADPAITVDDCSIAAAAAILLTYNLQSQACGQFYAKLTANLQQSQDFVQFRDFYVKQMPEKLRILFWTQETVEKRFQAILSAFGKTKTGSWVDQITALLKEMTFTRRENALLGLEAFKIAEDLPKYLRTPTRLAILDSIAQIQDPFVQETTLQVCEQLLPNERAMYRSVTQTRDAEFQSRLDALLSGFE